MKIAGLEQITAALQILGARDGNDVADVVDVDYSLELDGLFCFGVVGVKANVIEEVFDLPAMR